MDQQDNGLQTVVIGDVVMDAFIKLNQDNAKVIEEDGQEWLAMPFGQKLQFDEVLILPGVGNSANVAVSFSRLGLSTGFISNIGDDVYGKQIQDYLSEQGISLDYVKVNEGMATNYHYYLRYGSDRSGLIKREPYEYHMPELSQAPEWLYLSATGDHSALPFHDQLADWLEANPDTKFSFQPSTYHIDFGPEKLSRLYRRSEVFVANREETAQITGRGTENLHELFDAMHQLGPKIVVITDGPDGAYVSDGEQRLEMPNYPDPKPPLDRTGAGDAFAAAFTAYLAKGMSPVEALKRAPINSMSVVQEIGAQAGLVTDEEMEKYLSEAPDWYVPKQLN